MSTVIQSHIVERSASALQVGPSRLLDLPDDLIQMAASFLALEDLRSLRLTNVRIGLLCMGQGIWQRRVEMPGDTSMSRRWVVPLQHLHWFYPNKEQVEKWRFLQPSSLECQRIFGPTDRLWVTYKSGQAVPSAPIGAAVGSGRLEIEIKIEATAWKIFLLYPHFRRQPSLKSVLDEASSKAPENALSPQHSSRIDLEVSEKEQQCHRLEAGFYFASRGPNLCTFAQDVLWNVIPAVHRQGQSPEEWAGQTSLATIEMCLARVLSWEQWPEGKEFIHKMCWDVPQVSSYLKRRCPHTSLQEVAQEAARYLHEVGVQRLSQEELEKVPEMSATASDLASLDKMLEDILLQLLMTYAGKDLIPADREAFPASYVQYIRRGLRTLDILTALKVPQVWELLRGGRAQCLSPEQPHGRDPSPHDALLALFEASFGADSQLWLQRGDYRAYQMGMQLGSLARHIMAGRVHLRLNPHEQPPETEALSEPAATVKEPAYDGQRPSGSINLGPIVVHDKPSDVPCEVRFPSKPWKQAWSEIKSYDDWLRPEPRDSSPPPPPAPVLEWHLVFCIEEGEGSRRLSTREVENLRWEELNKFFLGESLSFQELLEVPYTSQVQNVLLWGDLSKCMAHRACRRVLQDLVLCERPPPYLDSILKYGTWKGSPLWFFSLGLMTYAEFLALANTGKASTRTMPHIAPIAVRGESEKLSDETSRSV